MDVNDYLLDRDGIDWRALLAEWKWLLPSGTAFGPWLMNRFGDVFWFDAERGVNWLSPTEGTTTRLAESKDEFCTLLDDEENANDWLMIPLVDQLRGLPLGAGQCYAFKRLPILGGEYEPDNVHAATRAEYWSFCGDLHRQLKDLPDGAQVKLDFT